MFHDCALPLCTSEKCLGTLHHNGAEDSNKGVTHGADVIIHSLPRKRETQNTSQKNE